MLGQSRKGKEVHKLIRRFISAPMPPFTGYSDERDYNLTRLGEQENSVNQSCFHV
jgi:hypothetical protein